MPGAADEAEASLAFASDASDGSGVLNDGTPIARPRLSGTNLVRAADHNQRVTLHAIRVGGSLTRVELARITGLTGPAIANITRRLLQDGMIEEAGQRRGGRGQPPTKLVVRHDACNSIGVNVDRDHVSIVLVDFSGRTLASVSEDVEYALPDQVRTLYRRSIKKLLRKANVEPAKLIGIGVAIPDDLGSVDLPGRPDAYSEWNSVDVAGLFGDPFALPVFVENDAAAAAIGEMQFGLGQQNHSFFYILMSSGLGGGFVVDGNYVRGANGRSGELGFMHASGDLGSGEPIQRWVSLSGLAAHLAADGHPLSAALADDPEPAIADSLERWTTHAATLLATPIEAINCLIDPGLILLGGRLPAALLDRLADRINARMAASRDGSPAVAPVVRAQLAKDAPAVGAAILPFGHFLLPTPGALWKAGPVDAQAFQST